jgi:MFS family permease
MLLRVPAVRWQALSGLLAQVTQGASGIGIILVVRQHTGSLALAGGVVGALSIAAGVARPLQGRLIDRRGAAGVIAGTGLGHAAALVAIVSLAMVPAVTFTYKTISAVGWSYGAGRPLPPTRPAQGPGNSAVPPSSTAKLWSFGTVANSDRRLVAALWRRNQISGRNWKTPARPLVASVATPNWSPSQSSVLCAPGRDIVSPSC